MLDYTTAVILFASTFILGLLSLKIPIVGIFILLIDVVSLFGLLTTGDVIMGYGYTLTNGAYVTTPIIQNIPELQYIGLITIVICIGGVITGLMKE